MPGQSILAINPIEMGYRVANGWPRELARAVFPLSTYSRMFATMNLLNLFRFSTLRIERNAQYEIRVYAEAAIELANRIAPVAVQAWKEASICS